jgi:DNA-cytosine methyltransferase
MITLIELFAGIGTQHYAFSSYTDIDNIGISEIDPRPLKAYKVLNGDYNNFGDITKIAELPYADIWTYSFPCTDLSIAGKQEGFSGEHSSLLYEVYRLLERSSRPKILIMENVSNLLSDKFKPQFDEWILALEDLGYKSFWKKIKACSYGGGTIRDRVFMISVLKDMPDFIFPPALTKELTIKDFLEPIDEAYCIDSELFLYEELKPNYNNTIKITDYNRGGQGNRIYSIFGQGVTLTAQGGGKAGSSGGLYARPEGVFKLSPIEMCKVMGWNKTEAEKICSVLTPREVGFCLGNAIDLCVMKALAKQIVEQYFPKK